MSCIRERFLKINEAITRSAVSAGRSPEDITLIAVSKNVNPDRVREAFRAGLTVFGENRAQEFVRKTDALRELDLRWHFIGRVQSNKARLILPECTLLHSLTSLKLATLIQHRLSENTSQSVLIQVNATGETSKSGIPPADLPDLLDQLVEFDRIQVAGLMTIGPLGENRDQIRKTFRDLRELSEQEKQRQRPRQPLNELSMGMSGDFDIAIEEGATLIRIGTAIFGPRNQP